MSMSEKAADVINQSAHRKFQTEYIPLVESAEVVSSRISSAAAALNSMYGVRQSSQLNEVTEIPETPEIDSRVNTYLTRYSQGKTINESTNQDYEFQPGDVVQTIKQGQQLGTVEKNDGLKVYHRHENGRLYASGASNLKLIKKASDAQVTETTTPEATQPVVVNTPPTSLQESINNILQQLNIESIDQLDESAQKELISIALDLTI